MLKSTMEYVRSEESYFPRKDSFHKFIKNELLTDNMELITYKKGTKLDYYVSIKRLDTEKHIDINVKWIRIDDNKGMFLLPDWDYYFLTDHATKRIEQFLKEIA